MMYLKRYTLASMILMALVGWFVYGYVTQESYAVNFFGTELPAISISLLVLVPVIVLYIASMGHMWFYSFLNGFKEKKFQKDYEKLVDAIVDAYVGKEQRNYFFKTQQYKMLGSLLENTALSPIKDISGTTKNEKIDAVLELIAKVKNGEVVDLKPYGLNADNALVVANKRNKYKAGELDAETILSNSDKYADVLCKEVYEEYVKTAPLPQIEKHKEFMTVEALNTIIARINADEHRIEIENEKLIDLMKKLEFDKKNFITVSTTLSKSGMLPEQRMKLFEKLTETHEAAMDAYLYTLFDLEMLAPANEILDIAQADEYTNFRAYRALKESGNNYPIDMFV